MLRFFAALIILWFTASAQANPWYISSAGSGSHNGTVNNNWTVAQYVAGGASINPNDTVHLQGLFTSADNVNLQYGGSLNNPVLYVMDPGCHVTDGTFNTCANNAGVNITAPYITLDGQNVGYINCTNSGQGSIIPGTTTGTFGVSESVIQAVTGATVTSIAVAQSQQTNTFTYTGLEVVTNSNGTPTVTGGIPDATHTWTGQVSGATLVPNGLPLNGFGNSTLCGAIYVNSDYVTVQNLSTTKLYVRYQGSDYQGANFTNYFCIKFYATNHGKVYNCVVSDSYLGIFLTYNNTNTFEISHCTLDNEGVPINCGEINTGAFIQTGFVIHDCTIHSPTTWQGNAGIHRDVHIFGVTTGNGVFGFQFYNNYDWGDLGDNATGLLFLEGYIYSPQIYNNVFQQTLTAAVVGLNGLLVFKGIGDNGGQVYNNTFYMQSNGAPLIGLYGVGYIPTPGQVAIYNNSFNGVGSFSTLLSIYDANTGGTSQVSASNNNAFYPTSSPTPKFVYEGGAQVTLATWQAYPPAFDSSTVITNPLLGANFVPSITSPLRNHGNALTLALAPFDASNHARPATPCVGAFEAYSTGVSALANGAGIIVTGP
jgi:hypothetical protein